MPRTHISICHQSDDRSTSMRVAHCIHGLGIGGAQQVVRQIVENSDDREFRYLVYSALEGEARTAIEKADATVRILPRHLPKLDPTWVRALARAMRSDRAEVVHTHLFGDSLHGYLAARRAGSVPVVMTLHCERDSQNLFQRLGYRWLLRRCARIVACSEAARRSWAVAGPRVVTIPNGIEPPGPGTPEPDARERARELLGAAPGEIVVAAIGRLAPEKGYPYLVRAFAEVVGDGRVRGRLFFIGEGPEKTALQRRADAEGVGPHVVFTGERSDVPDLLPGVDIVAFSSLSEGLSIALLEAMATARCIVGTDLPGIVEGVRHEHEALLVPRKDASALAAALRRAIDSPEYRRELGTAARNRYLDRFTATRMVRAYEDVYRSLRVTAPS